MLWYEIISEEERKRILSGSNFICGIGKLQSRRAQFRKEDGEGAKERAHRQRKKR
ncbi:hypothetical protein PO124_31270 [Bacillus licheniformis]|nr:hypothetical protein [Bacillus licheniformis]